MMRIVAGLLVAFMCGGAAAQAPEIAVVRPVVETPNLPDSRLESDGDDPAIWVHPTDPGRSIVAVAVKDGGIRVYDLEGALLQTIRPVELGSRDGRINNIDVAYGFTLADGSTVDVAVASDRGLDRIRVYRIDRDANRILAELTAPDAPRAFPERPRYSGNGLEANPLDDQNTAYGLTLWRDPSDGTLYVVATQRGKARLGLFRVEAKAAGGVAVRYVRDFRFPVIHDGQDLRLESDTNPAEDWNPQFEGLVVDRRTGTLYAGQEDVGIWRVDLPSGTADPTPFYETRGAPGSSFRERRSVIARDVEGLCLYYGPGNKGYLLASSQGQAHGDEDEILAQPPYDDSFAVFELGRAKPRLLGSFRVGPAAGRDIDAVQESDGADVLSFGLPGFERGLFVTQDGYDNDLDGLSGDTDSTNFKYVPWERIARSFDPPLLITPQAADPREP
jgi:3-phytase